MTRQGGLKSQNGYISITWGKATNEAIETKICTMIELPDLIMCAKFQKEIFRGYDFTGLAIFLLIFALALQQRSANALPVIWQTDDTGHNYSVFTLVSPWACDFASAYHISSKSNHPRQSYVISFFFKTAAIWHRKSTSAFGFSDAIRLRRSGLFTEHISTRYLNQRLRYYYFWSPKISGRHVGIMVSTLTYVSSSACLLHRSTKFRPNRTTYYRVMMSSFKTEWCCKSTFGFGFTSGTHLESSKYVCRSNFDKTPQPKAELLLLPAS